MKTFCWVILSFFNHLDQGSPISVLQPISRLWVVYNWAVDMFASVHVCTHAWFAWTGTCKWCCACAHLLAARTKPSSAKPERLGNWFRYFWSSVQCNKIILAWKVDVSYKTVYEFGTFGVEVANTSMKTDSYKFSFSSLQSYFDSRTIYKILVITE